MYAQVETLKEKLVKATKYKWIQVKERTKEYEVINHCIEYLRRYHELLVQQSTILLE